MQYIAFLFSFLVEITFKPTYIVSFIEIEPTIIAFYLIAFLNKKPSVTIPTIMLLISSTVTYKIIGLQSFVLVFSYFIHNSFFAESYKINNNKQGSSQQHSNNLKKYIVFFITFVIITLMRDMIVYIINSQISILHSIIYTFLNFSIFCIISLCFRR